MPGDRLDGATAGDHLEQFVVVRAEPAGPSDRVDQGRHDHGIEHRTARRHLADRPGELVALGNAVLQQVCVARGTFGEQRHRVVGVVVLAEDDDAGAGVALADLLAGIDALGLEVRRHADVTHDDVGMGFARTGDERVVVLGDADHLDVGVALQHGTHAGTDDRAVVGEKDSDGAHWCPTLLVRLRSGEGVTLRCRGGASYTPEAGRHPSGRLCVGVERQAS